jgi:hypothetical protein
MTRREVLLAILAASQGRPYTPVQLQKAVFLVTKNLPGLVSSGQKFRFVPYDYGPFDQNVYVEAETLSANGDAEISQSSQGRWNVYSASDKGIAGGERILSTMTERQRDYVRRVSTWVRGLRFEELVRAIYTQYPEMKANSIFRG